MMRSLLTVACFSALVLSAAPQWADKNFPNRVEVNVNAGMTPGKAPVASVKIPAAAPGSIMMTDAKGKVIPCVLKQDKAGDWFAGWKPQGMKMLEKHTFYLYFGGKAAMKQAEGFPENLPGMNLIPNAKLTKLNKYGLPEGWFLSSKGYGLLDKWNDQNSKQMKIVDMEGTKAVQFSGIAVVHLKVSAGRQYELSYKGWYDKGYLSTTVWYRGKTIHEYLMRELKVGNYKMQTSVPRPNEVMNVRISNFIYMDLKTKKGAQGTKLLPMTQVAFLQMVTPKDSTARIGDVRYEDITDRGSLKVKCGKQESLKK